jgi:fluoride ion exporter CrcB/FEX
MIVSFQIIWALGCIAWNAYALYLIKQGLPPIGPTASAIGAALCAAFALLFWWLSSKHLRWPYIILSAIAGFMAAFTIYGAFTKDPSLWPSESWRWAGIILNGVGVVACIAGIIKSFYNIKQFE